MIISILIIVAIILVIERNNHKEVIKKIDELNEKIDQIKLDRDCDIPDLKYNTEETLKILDPENEFPEDYRAIKDDDVNNNPNKHNKEKIHKKG